MIPFDFKYVIPETVEEAVEYFQVAQSKGLRPFYYGGGTEFISRARQGEINVDLVIDIKHIEACTIFESNENELIIGAAVPLTEIIAANLFPLLSDVSRAIATQTERNKITIGGNLMSTLPYKEALLPFLLANSELVVATGEGFKRLSVHDLHSESPAIENGEWIVQIITDKTYLHVPYTHEKRTKHSRINYPIVTCASMVVDNQLRLAMSGISAQPIRSEAVEAIANESGGSQQERIHTMIKGLPDDLLHHQNTSPAYREFVLQRMFESILKKKEAM